MINEQNMWSTEFSAAFFNAVKDSFVNPGEPPTDVYYLSIVFGCGRYVSNTLIHMILETESLMVVQTPVVLMNMFWEAADFLILRSNISFGIEQPKSSLISAVKFFLFCHWSSSNDRLRIVFF